MIQFGANNPFAAGTWPVIFGIGLGGLLATLLWYLITKWFFDRNKHTVESSTSVTRELEGQLKTKDAEIANLKAQISSGNTDWDAKYKLALADLDKSKKAASLELAALTTGAAVSAAAIKGKDEQIAKLTADLGAKAKVGDDFGLRFANAEKDWNGKVSLVTDERDSALKKISDLEAKLKAALDGRLALEADLDKSKKASAAELAALTAGATTAAVSLKGKDDEIAKLKAQLTGVGADWEAKLKAALDGKAALEADLDKTKKASAVELAALTAGAATAGVSLKGKDDEIAKLKAQLAGVGADWEAKLKAALDGKAALEADLDKTKKASAVELAALTAGGATAAAAIKSKDSLIADLNDKLAKLTADLDVKAKAEGDHSLRFASAEKDWTGKLNLAVGERDTANKTIADLNAKINGLNVQIEDGKKAALAAAAAATTAGVSAAATLKTKDDEIASLKAKLGAIPTDWEARVKAANDAKAKADADYSLRFDNAQKDWTAKLNASAGASDAANKTIADLNAKINGLNAEIDNGKKAAAAAAAAATAASVGAVATLKGKDDEIASLKAKLGAIPTDWEARIKAANDAKAKADADYSLRFENAQRDWNGKLNVAVGERDAANKQVADLNARINGLKADLDAKVKAEGDHSLRFANAEKDWTSKLNVVAGETDGLKAQIAKLNAELGDAKAKSNAELAALTAGAAASAAAIKSKDDELAKLKAQLGAIPTDWEARIKVANDAKAKADADYSLRFENAQKDWTGKLNASAGESDALKAQIGKLSGDLNARNADLDALKARLAAQEAQHVAQKQASSLELAALTTGAAASASAIKGKEDEIAALKAQLADLEAKAAAVPPPAGVIDPKRVAARKQALVANANVEIKTAVCPQHLSDAKGIGQVYEQKLYAEGIGTFFELANTPDDELRRIFEIKEFQDVDLAAIKADAIRLAEKTNSVGRVWDASEPDDLAKVDGIGFTYEKRLYDAGICTYAALVKTTPEELERICGKNPIRPANFASWIDQAKALIAAKS